MRQTKKLLAMLLCVAMCFSLFPTWAFAEGEEDLYVEDPSALQELPSSEDVWETEALYTEPETPEHEEATEDGYTEAVLPEDEAALSEEAPKELPEETSTAPEEDAESAVPEEESGEVPTIPEEPEDSIPEEDEAPVEAMEVPEEEEPETITIEETEGQSYIPGGDTGENLLDGYAQQQMDSLRPDVAMAQAWKVLRGDTLTGVDRALYYALKSRIEKVAAGEVAYTGFVVPYSEVGLKTKWTYAELGVTKAQDAFAAVEEQFSYNLPDLISALLLDCPYDLYWYNKTIGTQSMWSDSMSAGSGTVTVIGDGFCFYFPVANEYSDGSTTNVKVGANRYDIQLTVNTAVGASVTAAREKAAEIVASYRGKSDYDKMLNYKDEICKLVTYNHAATAGTSYGNPWQLIWVFDGDIKTNVVCEGYSKAFQYLCDLTSFSEAVSVYTVTGIMQGGSGAGNHMWNFVNMQNGKSYLVDVTNCDSGFNLFMQACTEPDENGFFKCAILNYQYDVDTKAMYSSDLLAMSTKAYLSDDQTSIEGSVLSSPTDLQWGKDYDGNPVAGSAFFRTGAVSHNSYQVDYYQVGNDTPVLTDNFTLDMNVPEGTAISTQYFAENASALPAGEYYFTVTSIANAGSSYANSAPAKSPTWNYVKPTVQLPAPEDLSFWRAEPRWTFSGNSALIGGADVRLYFSTDKTTVLTQTPYTRYLTGCDTFVESEIRSFMKEMMEQLGEGYYAWELKINCGDISAALDSDFSAPSEVAYVTADDIEALKPHLTVEPAGDTNFFEVNNGGTATLAVKVTTVPGGETLHYAWASSTSWTEDGSALETKQYSVDNSTFVTDPVTKHMDYTCTVTDNLGNTATTSFTVAVNRPTGYAGDNIRWSLADGVLTLSGTGEMWNYYHENYVWTPWTESSSGENPVITKVVVQNGITKIGRCAFENLPNLQEVYISKNVTGIGKRAFTGCGSPNLVEYGGKQSEWSSVAIADGNDPLKTAAKIRCLGDLKKLNPPTDVRWGVFEDGYPVTGLISYTRADNLTNTFRVELYQVNGSTPILMDTWEYPNYQSKPTMGQPDFVFMDKYPSGYQYYYVVTAVSEDPDAYADSDPVQSDIWTYQAAPKKLAPATGLGFDSEGWPICTMPADLTHYFGLCIEVNYRPDTSGTPDTMSSSTLFSHYYGPGDTSPNTVCMSMIQNRGEGYYSWRVRLVSDDIDTVEKSDWSAWSAETHVTADQIAEYHRPNEFKNLKQLKQYCAQSYPEVTSIHYGGSGDFVFTEDVTIPVNLGVWFSNGAQPNVIVQPGVTLTVNGMLMLPTPMTVNGKLINNGSVGLHRAHGIKGTLTVAAGGSYEGEGRLLVNYIGGGHVADADPDSFFSGIELSKYQRSHTDSNNNECVFTYTYYVPTIADGESVRMNLSGNQGFSYRLKADKDALYVVTIQKLTDSQTSGAASIVLTGTALAKRQSFVPWDGTTEIDRFTLNAGEHVDYTGSRLPAGSGSGVYELSVKSYPLDACGENLSWKLEGDTLIISGSGAMWDYAEADSGTPVTNAPWAAYKDSIKKIVLADGVTSVGKAAFYGMDALETVSLPKSVTAIGDLAFKDCGNLSSVEYSGKSADWNAIKMGEGNDAFTSAYTPGPELPAGFTLTLEKEYVVLERSATAPLTLKTNLQDAALLSLLKWSAEKGSASAISVDASTGAILPKSIGTDYVVATLTVGGETCTARCRVDVRNPSDAIGDITATLPVNMVTTDLYKTDYARFSVVLRLEQNVKTADVETPEISDDPVAGTLIRSARFVGNTNARLDIRQAFKLNVVDDRSLEIVPVIDVTDTKAAMSVMGNYRSKVELTLSDGRVIETPELTVMVRKTKPMPMAAVIRLNGFIAGDSAPFTLNNSLYGSYTISEVVSYTAPSCASFDKETMMVSARSQGSGQLVLNCKLDGWAGVYTIRATVMCLATRPVIRVTPMALSLKPGTNDLATAQITVTPADFNNGNYKLSVEPASDTAKYVNIGVNESGMIVATLKQGTDLNTKLAKVFRANVVLSVGSNKVTTPITIRIVPDMIKVTLMGIAMGYIDTAMPKSPITLTPRFMNYNASGAKMSLCFTRTLGRDTVTLTDAEAAELFDAVWNGTTFVITAKDNARLAADIKSRYSYSVAIAADIGTDEPVMSMASRLNIRSSARVAAMMTAMASGYVDTLRPDTYVTITPRIMNWFDYDLEKDATVKLSSSGLDYRWEDDKLIVFAKEGAKLSTTTRYTATISLKMGDTTKTATAYPVVRMGVGMVTQSTRSVTLSKTDRYDRQSVFLSLSDPTLYDISEADVVLVDRSGNFELTNLGGGEYAIGYKNNLLPSNISRLAMASVQIYVYLKGNGNHSFDGTKNGTQNALVALTVMLK